MIFDRGDRLVSLRVRIPGTAGDELRAVDLAALGIEVTDSKPLYASGFLSFGDAAGDELAGDELAGDELAGDELAGDELAGDELAGDEPPTTAPASPARGAARKGRKHAGKGKRT